MVADYRYIFGSLRTENVIAEIPLYGTHLELALNVGGNFNGTFQLDQTGKSNSDLIAGTLPGKTFVAVERNGICIWNGFVWSRVYQSQSKSCQLFARSFETFPQYQRVLNDFSRTNVEQLTIFKDLWTEMQAVPGRNMNILIPTGPFPTVTPKTVDVRASDAKYYSEVMANLSNTEDGFDWYIAVGKTGANYVKQLVVGFPTLGTPLGVGSLVVDYPGPILNYYQTESMTDAGTNIFVVGAGEGSTTLTSEFEQPGMIDQGWPRWDKVVPRKEEDNQSVLDGFALQEGAKRRPPMLVMKATFKGDGPVEFGSVGLGDTVRLQIQDARNPNLLDIPARMIKWTLDPPTAENTEEYNLVFEGDEDA